MPSETMEQRGVSASSHCHEDVRVTAERQTGLLNSNTMPDHQVTGEIYPNISRSSWTAENCELRSHPSLSKPLASLSPNGKTVVSGTQWESSLFSSSLSELFSRKLRLLRNDVPPSVSANTVASHHEEEEAFESLEEIEAQTIGNLLPDDDDDLFTGVVGEARCNLHTSKGDDMDDFDLFSSGGGMELEGDFLSTAGQRNSGTLIGVSNGQRGASSLVVGEHPDDEIPSRTLFVRNINSNIEDSDLKALFEQFGDIRTLHTACKNRGFVMISYYDIRAAQNAMRSLQDKLPRRKRLDIHYSIPKGNPSEEDINQGTLLVSNLDSSISDDEVRTIFGVYGEIKEVHETSYKNYQWFVEFFDVRAADAALCGLNGIEIAGKQIKLEPSHSEGARCFMPQYGQEDPEVRLFQSSFNNLSSAQIVRISPAVIASSSMDAGSVQVLHNPVQSPVNSFIESHQRFSIPIRLSSSARVMSTGKPIGIQEPNYSFDKIKMGNQCISNLHPHSLPEYHDDFANGIPYKSSKTFAEMVGSGQKLNEELVNGNIHVAGSNEQKIGFNGRVMGSSLNESSLHGNHNLWNYSNSQQQHLSCAMVWPNSPSRVNSIHSQRIPPVAAFPRAPPVMVNASSSPVHHHIGSAPAINPAFWDRKHVYTAESPESSGFHLGSHGSVRFGSSPSHPMDITSHNIFAHVGGGRMDVNLANSVTCSPQQMSHLFPGRNPMISIPGSYDSTSERFRNLSHRKNDSGSNNADKKQYELDVDHILRGEDSRTTLMIKNIPNKYTSKMLLAAIDEHCKGTYDFIYLPIDFKNKCNVGYAFINLIDPQKIIPFHQAFNGKKWEKFNSEKVASLAYARIQGKSALIAHFQNSSLMNEDKRCRPILFHSNGPNAGDQEPFPMGSNIRSRPSKPRTSSNENYNQFGTAASENQGETSNGADYSSRDSN